MAHRTSGPAALRVRPLRKAPALSSSQRLARPIGAPAKQAREGSRDDKRIRWQDTLVAPTGFYDEFKTVSCGGGSSAGPAGLRPEAAEAFARATAAYLKTTGQPISILSGYRSVRRQAELFIGHDRGSPDCHAANRPGCSWHQFGLAIDIDRPSDSKAETALNTEGWVKTEVEAGEPWHFDYTKSPAYGAIQTRITTLHEGLALQWVTAYGRLKEAAGGVEALLKALESEGKALPRAAEKLETAVQTYNDALEALKQRVAKLQSRAQTVEARRKAFNATVARANAMVEQMRGMPEGPARAALYSRWKPIHDAIEAERPRLAQAIAEVSAEDKACQTEANRLKAQRTKIGADGKAFEKLRESLASHQRAFADIKQADETFGHTLEQIKEAVR